MSPSIRNIAAANLVAVAGLAGPSAAAGTWTPVATNAPSLSGGLMILMSDGTVLCKSRTAKDNIGRNWVRLTPDIHGSYANGTWSAVPSMIDTRHYFSTQLLMDGRLYACGGEYGTGVSKAEIYDPLTNTWAATANSPGAVVNDANSEILPDGRVMQSLVSGNLKTNKIYNPATNLFSAGPSCQGITNEATWMKLPDDSIMMVDRLSTQSERWIPSSNTWVNDAIVPVLLYDPYGDETGGGVLLPNGKAFFVGSPGTTALYTPTGTPAIGNWVAGPMIPDGNGTADGPMAMMSDGKVLVLASPAPTSTANIFNPPTSFYEYDYVTNSFTQVGAPGGGTTLGAASYVFTLLDLPDGSVLFSQQVSTGYFIYNPGGPPLSAGKPTITDLSQNNCGDYTLTGTLFNGISEGASYGDDWQMNTNYPIVRMSAGANVYYCRTFNWNSTSICTGSMVTTTKFTVPASVPAGSYALVVTANGIASDPIAFDYAPIRSCDLDGDGAVDGADIGLALLDFGPCPGCAADIDMDGVIDGADIGLMLLSEGPCL